MTLLLQEEVSFEVDFVGLIPCDHFTTKYYLLGLVGNPNNMTKRKKDYLHQWL